QLTDSEALPPKVADLSFPTPIVEQSTPGPFIGARHPRLALTGAVFAGTIPPQRPAHQKTCLALISPRVPNLSVPALKSRAERSHKFSEHQHGNTHHNKAHRHEP
ncbi:MAG: hypothetical protein OEM98_12110, partial [Gammaproteobacteria bacterium]|nr:hypothetical protein [Gammaproteobacteria bacterium]